MDESWIELAKEFKNLELLEFPPVKPPDLKVLGRLYSGNSFRKRVEPPDGLKDCARKFGCVLCQEGDSCVQECYFLINGGGRAHVNSFHFDRAI
ncbi:MAG: hypothetical protein OYM47_20000 [Gemmatimonadota bacterium]|nr:hypothetical protein [Gemmatimonadota bacterium]